MRGVPKKYVRFFSYFAILAVPAVFILVWYQEHHSALTKGFPLQPGESKQTTEFVGDNKEAVNILRARSPEEKFIIGIGMYTCLHLTKYLEFCPRHVGGHTLPTKALRTVIQKDINHSKGFRIVGLSNYLTYDSITTAQLAELLSDNDIPSAAVTVAASNAEHLVPDSPELPLGYTIITGKSLTESEFVTEISVLFGEDCVDPRPTWHLSKNWRLKHSKVPCYLTFRTRSSGPHEKESHKLSASFENPFKIVQLADLHYSVGEGRCRDEFPEHDNCIADPKTLAFVEKVLDTEKPQLVVFTGDQIMGSECVQDSATALLKVVDPVIKRRIPYAMVWGNHDDEGNLDRWEISKLAESLPFSLFKIGDRDTNDNSFGVGNYVHYIYGKDGNPLSALYFLDAHKYSPNAKAYPGYDWIKEEQWNHFSSYKDTFVDQKASLSMAFFHIPLPEYLNVDSNTSPGTQNPLIGNFKEGVTAPKYNSKGIATLRELGVKVTSVGHDHCNDYCLLEDSQSPATDERIWLCFGGAAGEGGYGGYGGTERRIRIYQLDFLKKNIETWKVLNSSPEKPFDHQTLVSAGVPLLP
ncbi:LAQU0S16e00562g1_1 [Lachancea quebecensis]|uniref:LAQU0S16e00562g1_1 n=1 Tax=Lachancea quebecensis TaxID=1654605 RepID=A0A0P1L2C4_9SACH|nr:LAQU0S16e00562g1_1 [Lachancea quebecensis]